MILCDWQISELCMGNVERPLISPFVEKQVRERSQTNLMRQSQKVISYGLSSRGYDARLDVVFLKPRFDIDINDGFADPKDTQVSDYDQVTANKIVIAPGRFILGQTVEYFVMPRDIVGLCVGKSTYARCGLLVNTTPLEPGWEGHLTIEMSNTHEKPVVIYANEGICQIMFDKGEACLTAYGDRSGKYQGQTEPTVARI